MKKLLVLAVLSTVFAASAEDMWLRWMVGEDATINGAKITESTVYAKVKVDGGEYLSLYANPNQATPEIPGGTYAVDMTWSLPVFAGIGDVYPDATSFIVELYSDSTAGVDSWLGQTVLAYNLDNITSGGMSVATPAVASSFISIPEPTSGLLLLVGVAGLALRRRGVQRV